MHLLFVCVPHTAILAVNYQARRMFNVTDRKWLHVAAWVVFVVGVISIPLGLVVWAIGVYCELA